MRIIDTKLIKHTVRDLSVKANTILRKDVLAALKKAYLSEAKKRPKEILKELLKNAKIANERQLAICQDTGMPIVFVELGQDVYIKGDFNRAVNKGIVLGYKKGYLRASIVSDPVNRDKPGYSPAVIHVDIVKGGRLKITVFPKGFGCENKSQVKMFKPTAGIRDIKNFILETVKSAGPDACPPYVVGVGIGGTADYACLLAKKALLRKIRNPKSEIRNKSQIPKFQIRKLEKDILTEINNLNIGPMGLGGKSTALAVNAQIYPTHIAGLPVCVNISCHALRSATKTL
jgi:fumarate hydratase subunit alpha